MRAVRALIAGISIQLALTVPRGYAQEAEYRGKMVLIPASGRSFTMGDTGIDAAQPAHDVTFTYDFYMDTTEVTQADYRAVVDENPALHRGDDFPIENLTWYQAILYCNERSKRDTLDTVYTYTDVSEMGIAGLEIDTSKPGYRLPTEAEWEYACRAGSTTQYFWGDTIDSAYCHYEDVKTEDTRVTIAVASKLPNGFGLYDMSGNVWEYVNDALQTYSADDATDPLVWAPDAGTVVVRGGSHEDSGDKLQSAYREGVIPFYASGAPIYGFRAVLPKRTSSEARHSNAPRRGPQTPSGSTTFLGTYNLRGQCIEAGHSAMGLSLHQNAGGLVSVHVRGRPDMRNHR